MASIVKVMLELRLLKVNWFGKNSNLEAIKVFESLMVFVLKFS